MKKILILSVLAVFAIGCGNSADQTKAPQPSNKTDAPMQKKDDSLTVSSHSQNPAGNPEAPAADSNLAPGQPTGKKSKWTQSGTPIDTTAFDAKIAAAEKNLKAKSNDEEAKKALAAAFLERAVALTDARQYASALGDYRRTLKYDAGNEDAKKWIGEIIGIYDSLNKASPPEGEEPPPLAFKK